MVRGAKEKSMSLNLPALLCVCGLAACSSSAPLARAPGSATPTETVAGAAVAPPSLAPDIPAFAPVTANSGSPRGDARSRAEPAGPSRTTVAETNDDRELALRRIRQAAMADGSL